MISSGAAAAFEPGINVSKVIKSANVSEELVALDKNGRRFISLA